MALVAHGVSQHGCLAQLDQPGMLRIKAMKLCKCTVVLFRISLMAAFPASRKCDDPGAGGTGQSP